MRSDFIRQNNPPLVSGAYHLPMAIRCFNYQHLEKGSVLPRRPTHSANFYSYWSIANVDKCTAEENLKYPWQRRDPRITQGLPIDIAETAMLFMAEWEKLDPNLTRRFISTQNCRMQLSTLTPPFTLVPNTHDDSGPGERLLRMGGQPLDRDYSRVAPSGDTSDDMYGDGPESDDGCCHIGLPSGFCSMTSHAMLAADVEFWKKHSETNDLLLDIRNKQVLNESPVFYARFDERLREQLVSFRDTNTNYAKQLVEARAEIHRVTQELENLKKQHSKCSTTTRAGRVPPTISEPAIPTSSSPVSGLAAPHPLEDQVCCSRCGKILPYAVMRPGM
jgi:hypothetical protein